MTPDARPEPTAEQTEFARAIGRRLGRNLPQTGVMGLEDVEQLAVEAMLTLLAKGAPTDARHFGKAIRNRTIDALRREGVLSRVRNEEDAGIHYENHEAPTLDGLEPRHREILAKTFEDDLTPRGIAASRGGTTAGSVSVAKAKALHILRGKLSDRELDSLVAAANGLTTAETAAEFGLSVETVKDHRKAAMHVLSARGMSNAVAIAFQRGLLS